MSELLDRVVEWNVRTQPNDSRSPLGDRDNLGGKARRDVDATVAMRRAQRAIAFIVPSWNDGLLFVEREGMKEAHGLGVWVSLYGAPETTAAPLRRGLADLQSALSVKEE